MMTRMMKNLLLLQPSLLWLLLLHYPSCVSSLASPSTHANNNKGMTVIAGATGYMGKSVVRESVRQGYQTVALVRDLHKITSDPGSRSRYEDYYQGAQLVECDVTNPQQLNQVRRATKKEF